MKLKDMEESQNQLADRCRRVFAVIDSDGRGTISSDELLPALHLLQLNPTQDEVDLCLQEFEENVSNGFTCEQFEKFVLTKIRRKSREEMREDLRHAFFVFDQSNSGYVNREDFLDILTKYGRMKLNESEAEELLDKMDFRKDGRISIAELETILITEAEESQLLAEQKWDLV